MHHHFCFFVLLAMINLSLVAAQDLSDLPSCAQGPALSSIGSTGCALTDFSCICKDQEFIKTLTPVIKEKCSAEDIKKVTKFTQKLCGSVGVTVSDPGITASPTSSTRTASGMTTSVISSPAGSTTVASASSTATAAVTPSSTASSSVDARGDILMALFSVVGVLVLCLF